MDDNDDVPEMANNKKQPCGFMGCSEEHSLILHPPPQRAMVNVLLTVARSGKCRFFSHQNDPSSWGKGDDCELCGNREGGGDIGLGLLFGGGGIRLFQWRQRRRRP